MDGKPQACYRKQKEACIENCQNECQVESSILKNKLQLFISELKKSMDSSVQRTMMETLLKIFRNVASQPEELKYRRICVEKIRHILNINPARKFLFHTGWQQEGEYVVLINDKHVKLAVDVLVENRVLNPCETTFKNDPVEGPGRKAEIERNKKEQALKERDKELKECLDDIRQRKELAKIVKQEHVADRHRFNLLYRRNCNEQS